MDHHQIARDLIELESITGNEEPVVAYLEKRLGELGLEVRSEEVAPGRRNLIAGPENPALLFCTHTDTVPPYVPLSEDEEYIYGRGACDTKGITACFLAAGERLLSEGLDDFGYLFVVGEEIDNIGAVAANRSVRCGHVVVGEPTENKLALGHKGVLGARVKVEGRACHSAYPAEGDSAIHRLLGYLQQVLRVDFGSSELLGPATVNIGGIEGGVAHNVLAPAAAAEVMIRVVSDIGEVERRLVECFVDPATGEQDEKVTIEVTLRMESPVFERLEGFEETVVFYGTDAPFLLDVGKLVLFGPGSIVDAHTEGEKISKAEMDEGVESYVRMGRLLID